jgi:hypothetical protein
MKSLKARQKNRFWPGIARQAVETQPVGLPSDIAGVGFVGICDSSISSGTKQEFRRG